MDFHNSDSEGIKIENREICDWCSLLFTHLMPKSQLLLIYIRSGGYFEITMG